MEKTNLNSFFTSKKWTKGLVFLFFVGLFCLLQFLARHNFISHSEFWAIASGRLFGDFGQASNIIYVKSFFYSLLKIPFLFELDNVSHIQTSRSIFGAIAFLTFLTWYMIGYRLTESRRSSFFFILFLLSFQVIFYNIYRVRADGLSCLMISFFLLASLKLKDQKKIGAFELICLFLFFLLAFLATPKSIFLLIFLPIFFYLVTPHFKRKSSYYFLAFLAFPFVVLILAHDAEKYFFLYENPFPMALKYFLGNLELLSQHQAWKPLLTSFQLNFLNYILVFSSIFCIWKNHDMQRKWLPIVLVSLISFLIILFYPEKWEYFLANYLVFFCSPVLYLIHITKSKMKLGLATLFVFFLPLHMSYYQSWYVSNKYQLGIIDDLEIFVLSHGESHFDYFDSLGLLPRNSKHLYYIGRGDTQGNLNSFLEVREQQPTFVIYTENIHQIGEQFMPFLTEKYRLFYNDIWVKKDRAELFDQEMISIFDNLKRHRISMVFIYDYRPFVRFFQPKP